MADIEELYDSDEPADDCETATTKEAIATVDPMSRIQFNRDDVADDVISVRIDPH